MNKKLFLIPLLVSMMTISGCVNNKEPVDDVVKVTGVELNEESLSLDIGDKYNLVASVLPQDASDKTVTWTISDPTVASVVNGSVSALKSGDTVITVTTNDGGFTDTCNIKVLEASSEIAVNFSLASTEYVKASVDKKTAKVGEEITITINSVKEGYELSSISLAGATGAPINYVKVTGADNKYKYSQPADGYCQMSATVVGKDIPAYLSDEHSLVADKPQMSTDGGQTYTAVSSSGSLEGKDIYNFKYGSKVKFNLKASELYKPTGIKVDGVSHLIDEDGYVEFNVVIDDFDSFFLDLKVIDEAIKPLEGEYTFSIQNSSHITLNAYQEDKKTEIVGANQSDVVYLKVTSSDTDYGVREIKVSAPTSDIGGAVETKVTKIDDTWYSFKCPFSYSKVVTIKVIEANTSVLKDSEAVGTYLTIGISPSTNNINGFETPRLYIAKDGTVEQRHGDYVARTSFIVSDDGATLTTDGVSPYKLPYGNNLIFYCYDGDSGIRTPFGTYNYLGVKLAKEDDTSMMYAVIGEKFKTQDDHAYVAITVTRSGEEYATAFLDMDNKTISYGVSYNMLVGSSINDQNVLYEVFDKDNAKLAVVGSNGNGTYLGRCLMGDYYGTYTNETSTLLIAGTLRATYNDESFLYSLDENTITLTSSTRTIVLTLDNNNKTFAVVSDESSELDLPEFAGKKFRSGLYDFEDNIAYYGLYIEFSSTDMKMSTAGGCDSNLDMEHHITQPFAINVDVDYTYNADTGIVTANIVIKGGATKSVNFTYKNGKFQVRTTDFGSNFEDDIVTLNEI